MKPRWLTLGLVVLAVAMVAGTASAVGATEEVTDRREITVPSHKVWARGTGTIDLDASGSLRLAWRGDARIVDHAGDARVSIRPRTADGGDDRREELASDATYTLRGFDGVVWVAGSDFTVQAHGKVRRLRTNGEGTLQLTGRGRWFTKHLHGAWGTTIHYGAEPNTT